MTIETLPSRDLSAFRALNAVRYREPPQLTARDKLNRALAIIDAVLVAEAVINPGPMLWQAREDLREGIAGVGE